MHHDPHLPDTTLTVPPKLAWLAVTGFLLDLAFGFFSLSKRLPRVGTLRWLAVFLLRLACRALGHVPADSYLEFRADLPVQI